MKTLTITALVLLSPTLTAQNWCPLGATWVYEYTGWGADFREEHTYVGDTVFAGLPAQRISVHHAGFWGVPFDQTDTAYTSIDGDVILLWETGNGWDTLYWFGTIGDRWWPLSAPMNCDPFGILEIVDTGSVSLNGVDLRTWDLVYLDQQGQAMTQPYTLMERIGFVPRQPWIYDCNMVIDYFFTDLLCYTDSEMSALGSAPCGIDIGIDDASAVRTDLMLFPNPASTAVTVSWASRGPFTATLYDATGSLIWQGDGNVGSLVVPVNGLAAGPYLVVTYDGRSRGRQLFYKH